MLTRHITVVVRSLQGCGCKIGTKTGVGVTPVRSKPPPNTNSVETGEK